MKRHVIRVCFLAGTAALVLCSAPSSAEPPADTYRDLIKPTLAFVVNETSFVSVEYGTAFCIWSTPTKSYFLTAHHTVYPRGKLSIISVSNPGKSLPATVVRGQGATSQQDKDPDWAILAADIGNVPYVRLAPIYPPEDTDIEIAGYPVIQIRAWMHCVESGGPGCPSRQDPVPLVTRGIVNASTFPPFFIIYDAKTDYGNSGGPLFDKDTGDVYGVVTMVSHDAQSLPQVSNNLATSVQIFWRLVNAEPVHPTVAAAAQAYVHQQAYHLPSNIDARCELGMEQFSRGFGTWYNARASFATIYAAAATPAVHANVAGLSADAAKAVQFETIGAAAMSAAIDDVRAGESAETAASAQKAFAAIQSVGAQDHDLSVLLGAAAHGDPVDSQLAAAGGATNYVKSQREVTQAVRELRSAGTCRRSQ